MIKSAAPTGLGLLSSGPSTYVLGYPYVAPTALWASLRSRCQRASSLLPRSAADARVPRRTPRRRRPAPRRVFTSPDDRM